MEFHKYGDIENSYRMKFIEKIKNHGFEQGIWIVQEKVHGTNFSIWYDGDIIQVAKRTGFLNSYENFFNNCYVPIIEKLEKSIKEAYDFLKCKELILFGELFGGNYSSIKLEGTKRIQKRVQYSPHNDLYVFDIQVDGIYLTIEEMEGICNKFEIFYAKTLFKGTFEECLQYPNKFPTKIPEWLGLIPIEGNICEGVVIRPIKPLFFSDERRVLLKNKNDKFADKKTNRRVPKEIVFSELGTILFQEMSSLVTLARFESVFSKEGDLKKQDFGKVISLVYQDLFEEFQEDFKEDFLTLTKEERKQISKAIRKNIVEIIRVEFFKRV